MVQVPELRLKILINKYRLFSVLSLDVVAGAVASSVFFANVLGVSIGYTVLITLALTVWLIYAGDHLRDAKNLHRPASTVRHLFFQRHYGILTIIFLVISFADAWLLAYVPASVFQIGSTLFVPVVAYLIFQQHLGYLKEFVGALIYSGGVLVPAYALSSRNDISSSLIFAGALFFLTAWINLLLFSWFDREHDRSDGHTSAAVRLNRSNFHRLMNILFLLQGVILAGWMFFSWEPARQVIFAIMAVPLLLLWITKRGTFSSEYDRWIGDAVFVVPVFYLSLHP